jgi:hypothetical protein
MFMGNVSFQSTRDALDGLLSMARGYSMYIGKQQQAVKIIFKIKEELRL